MAITRFQDLPSTNTPINSTNLNGNFDELGVKVGTSVDNNYRTNIIKSKNLFDSSNVEKGYLNVNNGSVISSNDWNTTQFISLSSNVEHITIIGNKGTNEGYCFYDSSKTYISGGSMTTQTSKNITVPSNVKYFRITVSNDVLNSYAIYFNGNTTDSYEPYVTPSINVDGEEIYNKNMMDTLESLKPYILYESSSGVSTGSITLNDSKNNYKYMEVFCERSGMRTSHKFIISSSDTSTYALPMIGTDSSQLIIRTIGFTLSGTTLTITINNRTNIATNSTTFTPNANQLNIVMVIGYK